MKLLWNVIERHLDEAEFLWGVWEHSLVAPNYTLDDVARGPEARLLAHVDGLVVNGPEVARRLLIPAMALSETQRVCAAAMALLQSPGDTGVEAVVETLRTQPHQRPPLTRALSCAERPDVLSRMHELLKDSDRGVVMVAAEVSTFHHSPLGAVLPSLLASDDPAQQALGLKALPSEHSPLQHTAALQAGLEHGDQRVAAAAMEAGCRLGFAPAWRCVIERARDADKVAMLLLALGGGPVEHQTLISALSDTARRPIALWALSFVGTPGAVEASLEWMDDKEVGHLAVEVFTAVTGIELADAGLNAGPEEREALDHTAEDELPRPDPMKVRDWWIQHRGVFTHGQRYLMGKPRSLEAMFGALLHGSMRRRAPLLLDLQLRAAGKFCPCLETRAPTRQQYAELAAMRTIEAMAVDVVRSLF
jgi:uncharacterized protein (TIGR02270 family)